MRATNALLIHGTLLRAAIRDIPDDYYYEASFEDDGFDVEANDFDLNQFYDPAKCGHMVSIQDTNDCFPMLTVVSRFLRIFQPVEVSFCRMVVEALNRGEIEYFKVGEVAGKQVYCEPWTTECGLGPNYPDLRHIDEEQREEMLKRIIQEEGSLMVAQSLFLQGFRILAITTAQQGVEEEQYATTIALVEKQN